MSDICWLCGETLPPIEGQLIINCPICGVENDRTDYQLVTEKEEVKMIPETKTSSGKDFNQWLNTKHIPEKGMVITITGEWSAPVSPKISSFLIGDCEFNGETFTHGINQTSYFEISKVYGKDTNDWVGKKIEYQGKVKMGQRGASGHLWTAKQ